jgi:hypothetical protein
MDAKSTASETCSRYFSMIDSCVPHPLNVANHLKPLILEVTSGIIAGSGHVTANTTSGEQNVYGIISKRSMARLEAFVDGVSAAVPSDPYESTAVRSSSPSSLVLDVKSKIFPPLNNSNSQAHNIRRYANRYPQIDQDSLFTRLELYIRSIQRIYNTTNSNNKGDIMTEVTTAQQLPLEECNVHLEPTRLLLRTRVHCICRAFVANVSCVTLVQPVLLKLLGSSTRELLAVQTLSEDLWKAIKRELCYKLFQNKHVDVAIISRRFLTVHASFFIL